MPKITRKRLEIVLEKLRDGLSICDQGRNRDHCVQCPIKDAMIEAEAITKVMLLERKEIVIDHRKKGVKSALDSLAAISASQPVS